ncbi:MAG: division/cell wall cluster transcriptional repressor MraZ [Eubacteriales bacterium]
MLMGKYQNSIDEKGRMIIPAKYRDELGGSCVLTLGMDFCLYIYPMAEWKKFMDKLSKLPTADPNARAFVRHFYANAAECEIDKQGRIGINPELREYAGLEKELVTVGILDKIEIWSKDRWDENSKKADSTPQDFVSKMAEYGI